MNDLLVGVSSTGISCDASSTPGLPQLRFDGDAHARVCRGSVTVCAGVI
jgi:hypothetical protein